MDLITRQRFMDLAVSPAQEGFFNRNGADLEWHDGTAARKLALEGTTVSFSALTVTGNLTLGADVVLSRGAANRLDLASGDSINLVSGGYQVGANTVIDSARIADFVSLKVGGTEVIDSSRNLTNIVAGTFTGDVTTTAFMGFRIITELTISAGVVTATQSRHTIDTESDDATDDLDTINGGTGGDFLILTASSNARSVVVKDATGNLRLAGDFTMDNSQDTLMLMRAGTTWVEISRSNNAA